MKAPHTHLLALLAWTFFASAALGLGGCSYRHEYEPRHPGAGGRIQGGAPSFAEVRAQVFEKACATCHYHRGQFADYDSTFRERGEIREWVFVKREMPRGGALSAEQSELLLRWLDAGAPNEASRPNPAATATSLPADPSIPSGDGGNAAGSIEPTWENLQKHFFAAKPSGSEKTYCIRCHNADTSRGDLDLTDYQQARSMPDTLFERVVVKKDMPKNRADYNLIPLESKLLMIRWIDAGMPGPQ